MELALDWEGGPVQIGDIADKQKIPIRFLEQLMLILKRGELVVSTRGKKGGYALSKNPGKITVLKIIEILDGPIELVNKKIKKLPVLYDAFEEIQDRICQDLTKLTLEDLVFRKRQKDQAYIYTI